MLLGTLVVVFACAVIGLVLNLFGTVMAGRSIYADSKKHGGRPIVSTAKFFQWVRTKIFRRLPQTTRVITTRSTAWDVDEIRNTEAEWPPAGAPVEEQIRFLQRSVAEVRETVEQNRVEVFARFGRVRQDFLANIGRTDARVHAIEDDVRESATGLFRWELLGLVFVGVGTIILALPAVFGWG